MEYLASLYPPLAERQPLPASLAPAAFALTVAPWFFTDRRLAVMMTLPPLLFLCALRPCYTAGSPSADYNAAWSIGMPLCYLDFVLLSPALGEDALYVGAADGGSGVDGAVGKSQEHDGRDKGVGAADARPWYRTLLWAVRLMVSPSRGVGWNWRVKGIPDDALAGRPRRSYVAAHARRAIASYAFEMVAMASMAFCAVLRSEVAPEWVGLRTALSVIMGWSGGAFAWNGINWIYSTGATITVATGLCGQWEWPPLTGSLADAWSIRQMWR